jgi:hypothetical protein
MAVLPVPGGTTTWVVNNPQARPPSSSLAYETWVLEVTEYNKIMNSVAYYRWLWDQTQSKIGTG